MRFTTVQYLEKEVVTVSIRNNNASLAILDGMPVILENNSVSSVYLGVDVRTYSTANGVSLGQLFAGIAKTNKTGGLAAGDVGEAVAYGFTDAIVVRRTRAATTDSWASISSIGAGNQLVPETANNYLTLSVSLAIGAALVPFAAGESVDSLASAASTTNLGFSAVTAETVRMKVLVRAM